jgi:hypothetical protein
VDWDHARGRGCLRVPVPQFATQIPTGRQSSCPAPLLPTGGGQPDLHYPGGRPTDSTGIGPLWWARCSTDGRLHLLHPDQIRRTAAGDHARALCDQQIPGDGLIIIHGAAWVMCTPCVIGIPTP